MSLILILLLSAFLVWLYSENTHKRNILDGIHGSINQMTHSLKSLEESGKVLDGDITNLQQEVAQILVNTNTSTDV